MYGSQAPFLKTGAFRAVQFPVASSSGVAQVHTGSAAWAHLVGNARNFLLLDDRVPHLPHNFHWKAAEQERLMDYMSLNALTLMSTWFH